MGGGWGRGAIVKDVSFCSSPAVQNLGEEAWGKGEGYGPYVPDDLL